MPIYQVQVASGSDFDGTGDGNLVFTGTDASNDTRRAILRSFTVQNDNSATTITTLRVYMAADKVSAEGGKGFEILAGNDVTGKTRVGCFIYVPPGWELFIFTTGSDAVEKNFILDYTKVDVFPVDR